MTRERREEVVLVALVVSIVVHVGLMLLVRPQVMTRAAVVSGRPPPREKMRVTRASPRPDPVRIAEVMDVKATKDAPAAVGDRSVPEADSPSAALPAAALPAPEPTVSLAEPPAAPAVFEVKPVGREPAPAAVLPLTRIETPQMASAALPAPEFSVSVPVAPSLPAPTSVAPLAPPRRPGLGAVAKRTVPARSVGPLSEEVYEKVDQSVVAAEKEAVRSLVNAEDAAELASFVDVQLLTTEAEGRRYFKVLMRPRRTLPVVPKDVVMIIDGSGSIGNDRLGSCRKAARQILRTCTNTGDRFNLVVFRNAFSYAFRTWQECDAASFEAGDRWLNRQTAHGRTDVFSTISSVLTLPRDPKRPLVALVVTDGDANAGVSDTAEILSKFTALNDGLVSVYMYGVKSSANRELIDVLTHGNRGESFVFDGWRWNAGEGMEGLSDRFRDPVLSDLRVIFAADVRAESYPRLLRNLYRGDVLTFVGRVPANTKEIAFSIKGINGADAYEGFFRLPFAAAASDPAIAAEWKSEQAIDRKLGTK